MSSSVHDDRRKLDSILKEMSYLKNHAIKVGVFDGSFEKDKETGKVTPMAMIAAAHEYGVRERKLPERSFLRAWVINHEAQIMQMSEKLLEAVEKGAMTGEEALNFLARFAQGGVKETILNMKQPALKPATIKAKKSSALLRDTGQLLNSIRAKIVKAGTQNKDERG